MELAARIEPAVAGLGWKPAMVMCDTVDAHEHCKSVVHCLGRVGIITTTAKVPLDTPSIKAESDQTSQTLPLVRRLRVVIVEDEPIVAMELEMLLEDLEADVVGVAMSAADALALVREHRPDVVTMDINIKGHRDGVSAALEILETYGVRSIFISSSDDTATQKRAESCHAIAWIKKPIDTSDLSEAVSLVKRRSD